MAALLEVKGLKAFYGQTQSLYDIGFEHSKPNADPKSGGAEISIGGTQYSFGSLAAEFYYSNALVNEFPKQ